MNRELQLINKVKRLEIEIKHLTKIAEQYKSLYKKLRGYKPIREEN